MNVSTVYNYFFGICCLKASWSNKTVTNSLFVYSPDLTQHIVRDNEQIQKLIDKAMKTGTKKLWKESTHKIHFLCGNVCAYSSISLSIARQRKGRFGLLNFIGVNTAKIIPSSLHDGHNTLSNSYQYKFSIFLAKNFKSVFHNRTTLIVIADNFFVCLTERRPLLTCTTGVVAVTPYSLSLLLRYEPASKSVVFTLSHLTRE